MRHRVIMQEVLPSAFHESFRTARTQTDSVVRACVIDQPIETSVSLLRA